jgi:hypothetical protein
MQRAAAALVQEISALQAFEIETRMISELDQSL